jgi:hypothetical protein
MGEAKRKGTRDVRVAAAVEAAATRRRDEEEFDLEQRRSIERLRDDRPTRSPRRSRAEMSRLIAAAMLGGTIDV